MKTKILGLLAVALLAGPMSANAIVRTYDFTVNGGPIGPLSNVTSSGYFSFDENIIPVGGGVLDVDGLLTAFSFSWDGVSYNALNANTGQLAFDASGNLLRQLAIGNYCDAFAVGCGVLNGTNDWFLADNSNYDRKFVYSRDNDINAYLGSYTLSLRGSSVPEPGTLALLGLGLAGLGLSRRKKAA